MKQGTRYPPQNISNPFAQLHSQPPHQSHLQLPNQSLNHNFSNAHHAFASAGNQPSIFGPHGANGSNGVGSNLHAGFAPGGGLGGGAAASHAAQMGFAHHAGMQHLPQTHDATALRGQAHRIREVWKHNLAEEMANLRILIEKYPFISMDTEFPGVVARPIAEDFGSKSAFHYQTMRCNVDLLKIIQLGVTLFNADGELVPPNALQTLSKTGVSNSNIVCPCTWSFNFEFDLGVDMYNESSINLLKTAGVDFEKHATQGIDVETFGSLLITSGLTFSDDVWWISFHGGYDFGYLFKVIWNRGLPHDEDHYRDLVKKCFPNIFDVKFIIQHARRLRDRGTITGAFSKALESFGQKPGLQDIADDSGITRVGIGHTAGSDAWLTGTLFFEVRKRLYDNSMPDEFNGQMWGLSGIGPPASAAAQAAALASQAAIASGMASNAYHGGHGREGGPSTPITNPAGLATASQGYSSMTPGAGGAFGNFQYAK